MQERPPLPPETESAKKRKRSEDKECCLADRQAKAKQQVLRPDSEEGLFWVQQSVGCHSHSLDASKRSPEQKPHGAGAGTGATAADLQKVLSKSQRGQRSEMQCTDAQTRRKAALPARSLDEMARLQPLDDSELYAFSLEAAPPLPPVLNRLPRPSAKSGQLQRSQQLLPSAPQLQQRPSLAQVPHVASSLRAFSAASCLQAPNLLHRVILVSRPRTLGTDLSGALPAMPRMVLQPEQRAQGVQAGAPVTWQSCWPPGARLCWTLLQR